jgi:hypothetical protein
MRVLFIQQDHVSPTGPVGEAFAEARLRAKRLVSAFLTLPGSA